MFGRMGMMGQGSRAGIEFPLTIEGCVLFLDASDNSTVLNASGDPCSDLENVATWVDKSGQGNDVVQATVNKQPIYYFDSPDFNGAPAIVFDDVINSTQLVNTTGAIQTSGNTEIYGFSNGEAGGANGYLISGGISNGHLFLENGTPGAGNINLAMYAGAVVNSISVTANYAHVNTLIYDGASSYHRYDQAITGPANPGTGTSTGISIGALYTGAGPSDCEFGIVLVYNRVLTTAEIESLENWIYDNNKIGA